MGLLESDARHLTISASHCILCSLTATCAREQITAARRLSLARNALQNHVTVQSSATGAEGASLVLVGPGTWRNTKGAFPMDGEKR
ncbi:hypothetical protein HaLaN_00592 [Haematococcus lacustris]|uniref:Uncharacterized protein n=1 Tax=Haematococcus lacustris TaxID=44745 RepID=A0A699Y9P3_HAELA|nr:hypothetical protein HaLaN_00592 [Haematococcus lacustris]